VGRRGATIPPAKLHRQRRGERCISHLAAMDLDYLRGGARVRGRDGHELIAPPAGPRRGWTDCSGGVFYVCSVMGLPVAAEVAKLGGEIWTGTLSQVGEEGYSDLLTILLKYPFEEVADEGHCILRLRRDPRWHEDHSIPRFRHAEVGGSDNPSPGGGMSWIRPTPGRLAEFTHARHFPGY
jgi:hypothetical protein